MSPAIAEKKTTPIAASKGPELAKSTVLIKLEMHTLGNSRRLRKTQYEVDGADKDMTSANRKLLKSPELDEVKHRMSQAYRFIVDNALPFPINTVHMLALSKADEVHYQLKTKWEPRIAEALDEFVEKYEQRVAEAKELNPKVFNPLDYPKKEKVRDEFEFDYQFITIGVPEQQLNKLDPEMLRESRKKSERMWADAAELTRQMQVEIMQTLVSKLRDKLEDDDSGKRKKFDARVLENLTDFMRDFQTANNVTEFSDLAKLIDQGQRLLVGRTVEQLKDNTRLRDQIHADLKAIEKKLVPLVGERKFRREAE